MFIVRNHVSIFLLNVKKKKRVVVLIKSIINSVKLEVDSSVIVLIRANQN